MIHALIAAAALSAAVPDYPAVMKNLHVPGMQVVVVDHGKIVRSAAYGVKNEASQAPVDVHTRFEIGSITKQFTAAAILQLRDRGKLALDDKLGKYLPQYARGRNVTLRQMLLQISGIPDYTDTKAFGELIKKRNGTYVLTSTGSIDAVVSLISNKKLDFTPGSKWAYSNTNYYFLGHVVEVVSKEPWSAYIRTHIFQPAGMTESGFMQEEAGMSDVATGYMNQKGKLYPTGTFIGWAEGAGAIVSTATDLAKWDNALFSGKIIPPADVALMTTPGPHPAFDKNSHYAFGWVRDTYDGQQRIWHNGGTLGFTASNDLYPGLGQRVIVVDNLAGAADELANETFDGLHPDFVAIEKQAVAGEDPAVTARAKAIWNGITTGPIDRSQFTDTMNKHLTPEYLANVKSQLSSVGAPVSWTYKGATSDAGTTNYTYLVAFSSGMKAHLTMSVGKDGKVSAYSLGP